MNIVIKRIRKKNYYKLELEMLFLLRAERMRETRSDIHGESEKQNEFLVHIHF